MVNSIFKNRFIFLIIAIIALTAMIIARDVLSIPIGKWVFLGFCISFAIILPYCELIYFLCFLFPLLSGLPGNYILPIVIPILLSKKGVGVSKSAMTYFVVILLFELSHYFFYSFPISLPNVFGYLSILFLVIHIISNTNSELDFGKCAIIFCCGLVVFSITILLITQAHGDISKLIEGGYRIGDTKRGAGLDEELMVNANPNGVAFFSIAGLTSSIVLYLLKKINILSLCSFVVVFFVVGVLSLSRTWLLCVAFFAVLFCFSLVKKGTSKFSLFLAFSLFVLLFIFTFRVGIIQDAFQERMSESTLHTAGGRTEIFTDYNTFLINHPLFLMFGTGAVHYHEVVPSSFESVHNGLQQILVSYGIIGLIVFLLMFIRAIRKHYAKGSVLSIIPLIVMFLFTQSGQLLNPPINLALYILPFSILKVGKSIDGLK